MHLPAAGHMLPQQVPHIMNAVIQRAMNPSPPISVSA